MIIYTGENGEYQVLAEASQLIPETPIDYNISSTVVPAIEETAEQQPKQLDEQNKANQKNLSNNDKNGR